MDVLPTLADLALPGGAAALPRLLPAAQALGGLSVVPALEGLARGEEVAAF